MVKKVAMLGMVIPPLIGILISWGPINPYGLGLIFPSRPPLKKEIMGVDRPPDRTNGYHLAKL